MFNINKVSNNFKIFLALSKFAKIKGFNLEEFKKLNIEKDIQDYLKNNTIYIAEGSSRATYIISSKKVLKLAINARGIAQNQAEVEQLLEYKSEFIPKYYTHDQNFKWIIVELVRPLYSNKELKNLLNISYDMFDLFFIFHETSSSSFEEFLKKEFKSFITPMIKYNVDSSKSLVIKEYCANNNIEFSFEKLEQSLLNNKTLVNFMNFVFKNQNLEYSEIVTDNLGINSDGKLVILDLGGTKEVIKNYY